MRKIITIIFIAIIFVPAFSQNHLNTELATWEAKFEFDNELYPSFVMTLAGPGILRNIELPEDYIGDPIGMAEVWIVPNVENSKVRVEVQIDGWSELSVLETYLKQRGMKYRLAPQIRYYYDKLVRNNQVYPANVKYSVRLNDVDLGWELLSIRVRSINDVPFYAIETLNGTPQDFRFIFAGFVNENHPEIQKILQEALNWKAVKSFVGYNGQGGEDEVRKQVFAIWNTLQRRHMKYSNVTTPSGISPGGKVYSQAVRFLDESIDFQQANCVDGSVLIASILYKIGIYPVLVIKPGHMFVGYWLSEKRNKIEFIETTLIGEGHQPSSFNLPFGIFHPVELSESWEQFINAVNYANRVFFNEVKPSIQSNKPGYLMIDILEARRIGINAIPRH